MAKRSKFSVGFSPLSVFQNLISGTGKLVVQGAGASSLSEAISNTRVEPVTYVEGSLINRKVTEQVLMANLDTFTSWYLQMAAKLLNTDIDGARVNRVLGQLSTTHDVDSAIRTVALESDNPIGLPSYGEAVELHEGVKLMVQEISEDVAIERDGRRSKRDGDYEDPKVSLEKGMVAESAALSVGKEIVVKVGSSAIPVLVRLRTKVVDPQLMQDIFEANAADLSLKTRLRMYGMEEITLKQLITGSDILERQERIAVNDPNGDITGLMTEAASTALYGMITESVPLNRASSITVISKRTSMQIERSIGGRLNDYRTREKYFKGTASTMITVIDDDSMMVTTYYRGIRDRDTRPFSFFERRKETGNDLDSVIKALAGGGVPGRY